MPTTDPVLSALFAYLPQSPSFDPEPNGTEREEYRAFARKMHTELVADPMTCWTHLTFAVWWHTYVVNIADDPMFATCPWPADWPITPEELLTLREEYWLYYATCGRQETSDQWERLAMEARTTEESLSAFVARRISHLRVFELRMRGDMRDSAAKCIGSPLATALGTGPWTFEHPVYGTYDSDRVAEILARVRCVE